MTVDDSLELFASELETVDEPGVSSEISNDVPSIPKPAMACFGFFLSFLLPPVEPLLNELAILLSDTESGSDEGRLKFRIRNLGAAEESVQRGGKENVMSMSFSIGLDRDDGSGLKDEDVNAYMMKAATF